MRGLRVLILVCATVSAMGAMWMMRSAIQSNASLPTEQLAAAVPAENTAVVPDTTQVLVANREIPTGRVLGLEDLRWQAWPADAVSENFYTEGEDADAIETLVGSVPRLVIVEGEPITSNKIVDLNGTGVMASLLRPGMRAIAIPVSEITSAGGFILPGDFVDILLTRQVRIDQIDEESGEVTNSTALNQTDTIMKTVRVLAIDQKLNETNSASVGNSATLELTPEQAELITLTRQLAQQERGFLTLSLRSFKEMINEYGDDIDNVLPVTVLDLHAFVKERLAEADESRANYMKYAAKKAEEAKAEALAEEEAAAQAAAEAELAAAQATQGAEIAGTDVNAATNPAQAGPSTITLIRNGRPIVVHTIKAAAAILALSVALPAFADDGDYFIGPDGSVEYRDSASDAAAPIAPASAEPLAGLIDQEASPPIVDVLEQAFVAPDEPQIFEPVAYDPAPASTPIVQELSMEILTDASGDSVPEPVYTQSYEAPAATTVVTPVSLDAYTQAPVVAEPEPITQHSAPQQPAIEYVDAPVAEQVAYADVQALPSGLSFAQRGDGGYGPSTIDRGGESEAGQSTDIFVSKSAILNLPAEAAEISVSDPTAVRAVLRTARQVVLIGLRVGSTNIIVFDENNTQIVNLDVNVRYDLRPLRSALKRSFPDTLVEVEALLGEVVLTGAASSPAEATEIRNLVRRYLVSAALGAGAEADSAEFIDRLSTASDDQILLKVRVAEMNRSVVRSFGVDWSVANSAAIGSAVGGLGGGAAIGASAFDFAQSSATGLLSGLSGSIANTDFGSLVQAFEQHAVMRTLAEPTLTAISGETASFLAGGQFPIPTSLEDGEIGFEFRDFGVALEFTPVVVGSGRISLQIAMEISDVSDDNSVTLTSGLTIPGLSVRRANTTVELPSGGTMSIAGLLQQTDSSTHSGVPGIKNVPVLGQLFSSSEYNKSETELVILVTPYVVRHGQEREFRLPTDGFAPASDIDFFLLGRLHKVYGTGKQDVAAARQALNAPLGFIIEYHRPHGCVVCLSHAKCMWWCVRCPTASTVGS